MRRNLRLDWRALALLGALLTIMIKWPGEAGGKGLVHAMPTNSNREQLTEPMTTIMTLLQMNKNVSAYHNNVDIKVSDRQHNELIMLPAINVESTTEDETTSTSTTTTTPITTNIYNKNKNIVGNQNVTSGDNTGNISTNYTNEFQHKNLITNVKESNDNETVEYSINKNNYNNNNNNNQLFDKFKFTSNHHIAAIILSRTERSAVVVDNDNGNIVRRSPDITHSGNNFVGGLKSRRLNISRNNHHNNNNNKNKIINSNHNNNNNNNNSLDRNERSTISHLSGPSRKIQLFIKNRYLQLLPDGTINGTQDEYSEYTILQRSTVDVGRIKIQSVATCLYLCMDACGAVFGSTDFTEDCIFNENMEQHNYNTYSSTYNSNSRRTFYLALNRHGEPRRLQIPPTRSLGKLATYTNAITETVPQERVEKLIAKNFGENRVKHGIRQLCDTGKPLIELIDRHNFKARPMCNPNSSSSTNSNSSSKSSSHSHTVSSLNSQLINNLSVANDKNSDNFEEHHNLNNNSKINRHENNTKDEHHQNTSDDNQSSLKSSSSSSISNSSNINTADVNSIRKNQSLSGHIRNSSMISSSGLADQHHSGDILTKKKKRRKCRPHEDEVQDNCHRGPAALRKHNQLNANKKNNKNKGNKNKLPKCKDVIAGNGEVGSVPCHGPKRNGQKRMQNGHKRKQTNQRGEAGGKKSGRRGNGQQKKNNNKHNKKNNVKNGHKSKKEQEHNLQTNSSLRGYASVKSLERTTQKSWVTTNHIGLESTTFYNALSEQVAATDRAERGQRNVPLVNSMEAMDDSSEDDLEEQESENVSEEVEKEEHDDDGDGDGDGESNTSYEELQAQFTGGSDDVLYYDQLDFAPLALWEIVALLWILPWFLYQLS